jgi:hypothetical protein
MIADYYEMLGIEPGADRARVEEALARRQAEWSERAREPGDGDRYRGYLAQIPALRRALLGSDLHRAAYDAERDRAGRSGRAAVLDELQRLVALRAAKGGLGVRDRQALAAEAERRGVPREELDRLMEPFPPWPEPPAESDEHEPVAADAPERRRLRRVLDALGRRDLYDLLDLDSDAPAEEVAARLEAALRVGVAPDAPQAAAWAEALSLAQAHLGTREARARYDRGRGQEALERYDETLAFVLRGLTRLDPNTREALVQEAAALGIEPDRAERRIRAVCRREGVAIEVPAGAAPPHDPRRRWLRCRSCGGLTEYSWAEIHGGGQCRHCRAALRWACPVCQQKSWVDEPRCRCGFRQSDAEPMRVHFEAAQHAFHLRRYAEALGHLKHVQRYAPRHVGARKGIEKLQNQLREIRRLRAAYGVERAARRMAAARAIVEQWARLVSPFDARLKAAQEEVRAVLERALELTVRARRKAEADPAAARELYRQALAIAADLPEAAEGLRRCPPDGPADLVGEPRSGRVRLRWTTPPPDGIGPVAFRVLRKEGAAPTHADDGVHLGDVLLPEFEDGPLPPGRAFGYAVFAVREGVRSVLGVATGPIVVTDEARHVRAVPGRGLVELSWRLPAGAVGARVVRRRGAPVRDLKDGETVEARVDGATDAGLEDGRVYHYAVYALFRGPEGRLVPSRGVGLSAVPGEPLGPVTDLRAASRPDGVIDLAWTAPAAGRVRILRSGLPLAWVAGERRAESDLEAAEGSWIEPVAPGRAHDAARDGPTVRHYTPVTFRDGTAVIGAAVEHAHLIDPAGFRVLRDWSDPGRIVARLTPSDDVSVSYLIAARPDRWPDGPDDLRAVRVEVDPGVLRERGFVTIDLPPDRAARDWCVAAYAVVSHGGSLWTSDGETARVLVPSGSGRAVVWYRLTPHGGGKRWTLSVRTEPPGVAFGPTVLVAAPRLLPLKPTEGQQVARFPAGRDGDRHEFAATGLAGRKARLFAEDGPSDAGPLFVPEEAGG